MRDKTWFAVLVLVIGAVCAGTLQAQGSAAADKFLGAWTGTWDGAGSSGSFDLTLERAKDGPLTGKVSVGGEPSYQATLAEVAFDGTKMTARYEFTPQPEAEVVLAATFDGSSATGTWSLRQKGTTTEVISGNWSVKKK